MALWGSGDVFATLPDPRQRRSIPAVLFGKVLLAGMLPDSRSLRQLGATVFHRGAARSTGGEFYVTREGGARTGDARPFDVEALGDYLATLTPTQYTAHAQMLARCLWAQDGLQGTTWAIDCVDVRLPKGRMLRGMVAALHHLKVAVLSVLTPSGALPLFWPIGTPQDGDVSLAQPLWNAVVTLWGEGACRELLVDAGFLDGAWLAQLHAQGTTVITRVREGMDLFTAAQAFLAMYARPLRREITGLPDRPGREAFGQDLALYLVGQLRRRYRRCVVPDEHRPGTSLTPSAVTLVATPGYAILPEAVRQAHRLACQEQILAHAAPAVAAPRKEQACLAKYLTGYVNELFVFVQHPEVPRENNLAECAIRPLVITRKVCGDTRSANGSKTKMVLMSLLHTAQVRGLDPLFALERMLLGTPMFSASA